MHHTIVRLLNPEHNQIRSRVNNRGQAMHRIISTHPLVSRILYGTQRTKINSTIITGVWQNNCSETGCNSNLGGILDTRR
jgi:hypothetical protein